MHFNLHDRLRLLGVPLRLRFETSDARSEPLSDILLTSESDIVSTQFQYIENDCGSNEVEYIIFFF